MYFGDTFVANTGTKDVAVSVATDEDTKFPATKDVDFCVSKLNKDCCADCNSVTVFCVTGVATPTFIITSFILAQNVFAAETRVERKFLFAQSAMKRVGAFKYSVSESILSKLSGAIQLLYAEAVMLF